MASTKMYKASAQIPTKKLGKVNLGRYVMIPPPPLVPDVKTDLIPPDNHTLDEWVEDWRAQMRNLQDRFQKKVTEVSQSGRQGQLGVSREGTQRTPAVAVSYLALQLIRETKSMTDIGTIAAKIISKLREDEER